MWTRAVYPDFDIYSPPYRHGTITDVLWSMFNLSHGPAYNEAAYIMRHAGQADRLYLSGHSGGVQRSAGASRILANHGYSPQKSSVSPAPMLARHTWINVSRARFISS